MKIAVVDDMEWERNEVSDCCNKWAVKNRINLSVNKFTSGEEFLEKYTKELFDLVFMDIYMKSINGIETAKKLRKISMKCMIVFLTSSKEHAWEAFPLHPFDYILKPYKENNIFTILKEASSLLPNSMKFIEVTINRQKVSILLSEIVYIQSSNHHVLINCINGRQLKVYMKFVDLCNELYEDSRFLMCNRGIVVNMDFINKSTEDCFILKDGSSISLRVRDIQMLQNAFAKYQFERAKKWRGEK